MNKTIAILNRMDELIDEHAKTSSILGARAMVLSKFLDVTLPRLTSEQRGEIRVSLRTGIEETMSLTDDIPLSADYHSALLDLTNVILGKLGQQSCKRC